MNFIDSEFSLLIELDYIWIWFRLDLDLDLICNLFLLVLYGLNRNEKEEESAQILGYKESGLEREEKDKVERECGREREYVKRGWRLK